MVALWFFPTEGHRVHALSTYAKVNWLFKIYIACIQNEIDNYFN